MTAEQNVTRLLTDKTDLGATRIDDSLERPELAEGEAVLSIRRFALTTNNITYAAYGDAMHYWDFFPTGEPGWGHMPVWGFATVMESRVAGVTAGEQFYGYFPIASTLVVQPVRVSPRGFFDATPHRSALPTPYNQYSRTAADPAYSDRLADYQMLMRPLFFTAWMLADFLADNDFFGARQIVMSSASSKTAYGAAFVLQSGDFPPRIGLTSVSNMDYVSGLGLYNTVHGYDELSAIEPEKPTLYIDFAGRNELNSAVHAHFGASLVHHCTVGSAASPEAQAPDRSLEPAPRLFFAPDQIAKRTQDWGADALQSRYAAAEHAFLSELAGATGNSWMILQSHRGFAAAGEVIRNLHDGQARPADGHVVCLDDA